MRKNDKLDIEVVTSSSFTFTPRGVFSCPGAKLSNARTPAVRFYERHGFAVVSEEWDEPDIGPHVRMERPVG